MGLKTKNYTIEEIGLTLPNAYAVIRNIYIDGERGVAEFAVQTSRENAFNKKPIKIVSVEFTVDRNENVYKSAYRAAKDLVTIQDGAQTATRPMPFFGWTDDTH
jgi:hypothetical protein